MNYSYSFLSKLANPQKINELLEGEQQGQEEMSYA